MKQQMRLLCFSFLIITSSLLMSSLSQAKVFRNAYISFELPPNWKCHLEETEWLCRSQYRKQAKEAIIIITAKEVGPSDSFGAYKRHLKTPRLVRNHKGQNSQSKIYHVKEEKINDHTWVDGWHLGSELPSYYTRYMTTLKDRIAILVTFSAHKKFYTRYSKDFFSAIKSLRVIASKGLLNRPSIGSIRPGSETIGSPIGHIMGQELGEDDGDLENDLNSSSSNTSDLILGLALLLIAIGGYLFYKKRK